MNIILKKLTAPVVLLCMSLALASCLDSTSSSDDDGEAFNHQRNPGTSAEALLRDSTYTSLAVEVDYMPGHEPTSEALDSLKSFLEQRLNKSNITVRTPTEIPTGGQQAYSASDVRDLEAEHRNNTTSASSSTLEAYIIIVDGEYTESNVLGIAYYNTSTAFFGPTIQSASSGVGAPSQQKIEGTVFRHEFGHIMGLVGVGTPVQASHQTGDGQHCNRDGCLMEPSVETTDYFANLFDGDIPNLGSYCINDLQANGGK
ncbi:MAG: hypothetical protein U5K31_07500 [Balneolaceae bacterium]|nr:hypothetical protein [Balneolaceae bacterium]